MDLRHVGEVISYLGINSVSSEKQKPNLGICDFVISIL